MLFKGFNLSPFSKRFSFIDIAVNKNGAVRIRGDNITLQPSNQIKLSSRAIRMEASDEISLQAPKIWSRGKKVNLVPKTFMQ